MNSISCYSIRNFSSFNITFSILLTSLQLSKCWKTWQRFIYLNMFWDLYLKVRTSEKVLSWHCRTFMVIVFRYWDFPQVKVVINAVESHFINPRSCHYFRRFVISHWETKSLCTRDITHAYNVYIYQSWLSVKVNRGSIN